MCSWVASGFPELALDMEAEGSCCEFSQHQHQGNAATEITGHRLGAFSCLLRAPELVGGQGEVG